MSAVTSVTGGSSLYQACSYATVALLGAVGYYRVTLARASDNAAMSSAATQVALATLIALSGFVACTRLIPRMAAACVTSKTSLWGRDINKRRDEKVPESLGFVCGMVFLSCVILFQPFFHRMLGEYNAAIVSISFALLLGFADDVLDLRWSVKIALSAVATLPLLIGYAGPTNVVVPIALRASLGETVQLGVLYHVYMLLVAVFCTNSINIYAGINGLEVGQSLVIAVSVALHNAVEVALAPPQAAAHHLLSFVLLLPFIAVSLALFGFNKYPSQVFVGDSYTYFAGMTLAVAGILGHCSKTLLMLFLPELINFTLSLPQLLHIVPIPRHRVPTLDEKTGLLFNSRNYTLINLYLWAFGPTHERTLTRNLLVFQALCSVAVLSVRYYFAYALYGDRIE
jgi:UDP-N-acetylglucosamine--dolichyl-phosphate N-acetylglucosaminephosphotransferase